jgi:hypothetical protein
VAWILVTKEWRPVTETGFGRKNYAHYVWRSVRGDGDTKTAIDWPADDLSIFVGLRARSKIGSHMREWMTVRRQAGAVRNRVDWNPDLPHAMHAGFV